MSLHGFVMREAALCGRMKPREVNVAAKKKAKSKPNASKRKAKKKAKAVAQFTSGREADPANSITGD